jgi:hypothetical protein
MNVSQSGAELYPPSISNLNRGHSRQPNNCSTTSINSTNNYEKNHLRLVIQIIH